MNKDFVRIAHRRSIYAELQRFLLDRFVSDDVPAKDQIICEEVPFADKEVSQEALYEVLDELERHQNDERYQMSQFEFRRRERPQQVAKDEPKPESKDAPSADQPGPNDDEKQPQSVKSGPPGDARKAG